MATRKKTAAAEQPAATPTAQPEATMAAMPGIIEMRHPKDLKPSPFNPRHCEDKAADAELAASARAKGILQPIVARPVGNDGLEIVFGHRRHRAAIAAELAEVPVIVREMNDAAAREAQHVENIQRQDVHPMDEAESFEELMRQGYTAEALAAQIGKSTGHIYGRLKLLALGPKARQRFFDGDYGFGIALLLARVKDDKVQAEVAAKVKEPFKGAEEPMSYRAVRELLRTQYRVVIEGEYDAVAEQAVEAAWQAATEHAAASGAAILGAKILREVFPWGTPEIAPDSIYADEHSACTLDPKQRPWGKVLGKKAVDLLKKCLARDPQGAPRWLFAKVDAAAAGFTAGVLEDPKARKQRAATKKEKDQVDDQARGAGVDTEKEDPADERDAKAAERAKKKEKLLVATAEAALFAAVARVESPKKGDGKKLALVMARAGLRAFGFFKAGLQRRGLDQAADIMPKLAKMTEPELLGVAFECLLGGEVLHTREGYNDQLKEMCTTLGIDLKAVEDEQKKAAAAD